MGGVGSVTLLEVAGALPATVIVRLLPAAVADGPHTGAQAFRHSPVIGLDGHALVGEQADAGILL